MSNVARMKPMPFVERLRTFTDPNACWDWPGFTVDGYGKVGANLDARGHRVWFAHRAAYTVLVGPVPEELELDHLCRNRRCINPRHLEPVTPRENTLRSAAPAAKNARKTHCVHGHPLTDGNVYYSRSKYGTLARSCVTCTRAAHTRVRRAKGERPREPRVMCKAGLHELTPENTFGGSRRKCRACYNAYRAKWARERRRTA